VLFNLYYLSRSRSLYKIEEVSLVANSEHLIPLRNRLTRYLVGVL